MGHKLRLFFLSLILTAICFSVDAKVTVTSCSFNPTGDLILYYNNADSKCEALTPGTNLTITGGVLNAAGGGSSPGGSINDIQTNNGSGGFGGTNNATVDNTGSAALANLNLGTGANPALLKILPAQNSTALTNTQGSTDAWRIKQSGGYLYVAGYSQDLLTAYSLASPAVPAQVGQVSAGGGSGRGGSLDAAGNYVYFSDVGTGLLSIFNISAHTNPVLVGSVGAAGEATVINGNYLYTGNPGSLVVVNVTNRAAPTVIHSIGVGADALAMQGNYLYAVSSDTNKISIYDITTASNPTFVRNYSISFNSSDAAFAAASSGALVFGNDSTDISVYSISGSTLTLASTIPTASSDIQDVEFFGNNLLVADYNNNFVRTYSLTDPMNPVSIVNVASPQVSDMVVVGNYLYSTSEVGSTLQTNSFTLSSQSTPSFKIYDFNNNLVDWADPDGAFHFGQNTTKITAVGDVTALSFTGNGSGLTNVVHAPGGIDGQIQWNNANVLAGADIITDGTGELHSGGYQWEFQPSGALYIGFGNFQVNPDGTISVANGQLTVDSGGDIILNSSAIFGTQSINPSGGQNFQINADGSISFDAGSIYSNGIGDVTAGTLTITQQYINLINGGYIIGPTFNINEMANGNIVFDNGGISSDGSGHITANSFITSGGSSGQFVKGDGTLDSNTYASLPIALSDIGDGSSNISQWNNDAGYSTFTPSGTVAYQGDNISEFTNDIPYITSSDLSNYVPYNGAISAVDLGPNSIYFQSDTISIGDTVGSMAWINGVGAASFAGGAATIDSAGIINTPTIVINSGTAAIDADGSGNLANNNINWDAGGNIIVNGTTNLAQTTITAGGNFGGTFVGALEVQATGTAHNNFALRVDYNNDNEARGGIFFNQGLGGAAFDLLGNSNIGYRDWLVGLDGSDGVFKFADSTGTGDFSNTRISIDSSGDIGFTSGQYVTISNSGAVKIADGTQSNGYVFTSDVSGNGSWQAPSIESNYWTDTGTAIYNNTDSQVFIDNSTDDGSGLNFQTPTLSVNNNLTVDTGGNIITNGNATVNGYVNIQAPSGSLGPLTVGDISGVGSGAGASGVVVAQNSPGDNNDNLAFFDDTNPINRAGFTLANSGDGEWYYNFMAFLVHGTSYASNNYPTAIAATSDAGKAIINAQSNNNSNTEFLIGSPNNIPVSIFANSTIAATFNYNNANDTKFPNNVTIGGKLTVDGPIDPTWIDFVQQATPGSNPVSGSDRLYFKSDDNLYAMNSSGVEIEINGGGGGGSPGSPSGSLQYNCSGSFCGLSTASLNSSGQITLSGNPGSLIGQLNINANGVTGSLKGQSSINFENLNTGKGYFIGHDVVGNGAHNFFWYDRTLNQSPVFWDGDTGGTNTVYLGSATPLGLSTPGNVIVGGTSDNGAKFQVTGTSSFIGNIIAINNVTTSFPSSQGAAGTNLTNNGSGTLTWVKAPIAASISQSVTAATTVTVTLPSTQTNNTYKLNITPTSLLSTAAFYVSAKTTTTFTVTYATALTGTVTFDYALFP